MKLLRTLVEFLRVSLTPSEANITGIRRPLGYSQILNATLAASTGIVLPTPPAGMVIGYAVIQCAGGVVRWRDDGVAPTSTIGMQLVDGAELNYPGDFSAIRFIAASGTPILDIVLYA